MSKLGRCLRLSPLRSGSGPGIAQRIPGLKGRQRTWDRTSLATFQDVVLVARRDAGLPETSLGGRIGRICQDLHTDPNGT